MLTVDDYARIRRAYRDGMPIREIARRFHHSRRKVREALARPEPEPYRRSQEPAAAKLGRFKARIDEILAADEAAPRKQRHRATPVPKVQDLAELNAYLRRCCLEDRQALALLEPTGS